MKTLILNGSPRKNGDTASLLSILVPKLQGEVKIIRAYDKGISPCIDCRGCTKKPGCAIHDGMDEVYAYLKDCDNVVIASPVYFSQPTGPLMCLGSRLQALYCTKRFLGTELISKEKRGGIIFVGGGEGSADPAIKTARMFLRLMKAGGEVYEPVCCLDTDRTPACQMPGIEEEISGLASFLNEVRRK